MTDPDEREDVAATGHQDDSVVTDGMGSEWPKCGVGCMVEVVRPGKIQCECDFADVPMWLKLQAAIDMRMAMLESLTAPQYGRSPMDVLVDDATGVSAQRREAIETLAAEITELRSAFDQVTDQATGQAADGITDEGGVS